MMRFAPTSRAPWSTLSPMPPRPNTATLAPGVDFGGIDHCADTGGDPTADVADLVEGRILADFRHRNFRHHREIRKRGRAHVVVQRLRRSAKSGWLPSGIRPLPWVSRMARAQIGFARGAGFALPTFRNVQRNHMIARSHRRDARARPPPPRRRLRGPGWPETGLPDHRPDRVKASV